MATHSSSEALPGSSPGLLSTSPADLAHEIVRVDTHRLRIALSGEVDLSTADSIEAAVTDALRSHAPRHISVDLAGVRFLDSSGISALLRSHARAAKVGCRLAVTNPQPTTQWVLETSGVLDMLMGAPPATPVEG